MPQFRVLDQNDFITTMAVFLMLFLFIALICFGAVLVIVFTRCMTLALTNLSVYPGPGMPLPEGTTGREGPLRRLVLGDR